MDSREHRAKYRFGEEKYIISPGFREDLIDTGDGLDVVAVTVS